VLDLIIIGAGPAGIYAAYLAGLRQLKTVVLESLGTIGGQLKTYYPQKPIYDIPGMKHVLAETFIDQLWKQYETFMHDVPIHMNVKVDHVKPIEGGFEIKTAKDVYQSKTILLCSGAGSLSPRRLEGIDDHRVVYAIHQPTDYKNKTVAVLGGGDSALDWANELATAGANVTLIHRRDEFRALASMVDKFNKLGKMLVPFDVTQVETQQPNLTIHLKHVTEGYETQWQGDFILVCYGFVADTGLLNSWGIETFHGKALVHSSMETSVPGVYGVGNAITYEGKAHTIASAFGEVNTAIESIHHHLHPGKKLMYSSFLNLKPKES
jgi:thioredoxin reductase (NADPH)